VDPATVAWVVGRTAGVGALTALCLTALTGAAMRLSTSDSAVPPSSFRLAHEISTFSWGPLAVIHVAALVVDPVAHLRLVDGLVPFASSYGGWPLALGVLSLDAMVLSVAAALWHRRLTPRMRQVLHRLAYPAVGLAWAHSIWSGSDMMRAPLALSMTALMATVAAVAAYRLLAPRVAVG